jgi:hypothetical protein
MIVGRLEQGDAGDGTIFPMFNGNGGRGAASTDETISGL